MVVLPQGDGPTGSCSWLPNAGTPPTRDASASHHQEAPGWLFSSHFTSTRRTGAPLPTPDGLDAGPASVWTAESASGQGVTIQAEAVVNDAHTLYLIVEADSRDRVEGFMAPFAQAGTVEVLPASSCEAVIGRGGAAQARRRRLAGHCVLRSPAAWRCRSAYRPLTPGHDTRELKRVRSSRAASIARTDGAPQLVTRLGGPARERDRCGQTFSSHDPASMSWVDRAWSTQINPICTAAGLSERYPAAAHIGRDDRTTAATSGIHAARLALRGDERTERRLSVGRSAMA